MVCGLSVLSGRSGGLVTEEQRRFVVGEAEEGLRLDKFLARQALPLSRSRLQSLIRGGKVSVNSFPSRCSQRVAAGNEIVVVIPHLPPGEVLPENIPLHILYEDDQLLVLNKPAGMVVHPAAGHDAGTLVNALLFYSPRLSTINGPLRPGIVHRLDKDTSGALVVAKTDEAHLHLAREIKEHKLTRQYLAVVQGEVELETGTIEAPLGRHIVQRKKMAVRYQEGKLATTHYRVLERFGSVPHLPLCHFSASAEVRGSATLLEATLATGRTHQIRVHLAHIGHPVVGDKTYGRGLTILINRQALHAQTLGFIHPSKKEYMEFVAPLPEDMEKLLQKLRS